MLLKGFSMRPFLRHQRDVIVLAPIESDKLCKGMVVLFRYRGAHLLHRYRGTYDGKDVELVVQHAHLPGLSADLGVYVELAFEEYGLLRFMTANKYAVAFMKLGQEYLYRQTLA